MAGEFTNADKAKCARRELGQRRRVYPRLVEGGKMTQANADREMRLMELIAEDFELRAEQDKAAAAPGLPL
jgi:hypothetical protein